jgi:hypothetical protein
LLTRLFGEGGQRRFISTSEPVLIFATELYPSAMQKKDDLLPLKG